ncbi:PREDICTED: deleted in esophageal cancer 1, partial [Colobus angolensis palliatus]|uniref:deleted in esophageal cancer 1 n=1 Tax=Colobus angolensis palliatus TaxID=336983 RepID=UPI0005F54913
EAGKWKSIMPAPGEGLLAIVSYYLWVFTDALHRERSVKWQAGVCYNGGKDFAVSLVRPNAAEGIVRGNAKSILLHPNLCKLQYGTAVRKRLL